jgi:FkbM family methyltransferase
VLKLIPYPSVRLKNYINKKFYNEKLIVQEIAIRDDYGLKQLMSTNFKIENIVDIGAHIGIFVNYAKYCFPNSKILAYEPWTFNYNRLIDNVATYDNVLTFNAAITNEITTKYLRKTQLYNTGAVAIADEGFVAVNTLTLQHAFQFMEKIDLLKLDCEGGEYEILNYAATHGLLEKIQTIRGEYHKGSELLHQTLKKTHRFWAYSIGKSDGLFRATLI